MFDYMMEVFRAMKRFGVKARSGIPFNFHMSNSR